MKLDIKSTVILRSYVVDGSETGDFTWDGVSRYRFSQRRYVKMERVVPGHLFRPRTFILWKIYTKNEIIKKRLSEWGDISSWTVGSISESSSMLTNTGGKAWDFEDNVNKPILEAWRNKGLFYAFRISSEQANILIFPCPVIAVRCSFPQ